MNDEFIDGNIEKTYEELTKVINATNDLRSSLALSAEEFSRKETEFVEVHNALHNIRIKVISNPILRELNSITEEDATLQLKLAEDIYFELTDLSSKMDVYQESFTKFDGAFSQIEKLHSTIKYKMEEKIKTITCLEVDLKNKYAALLRNYEMNGSEKCQELKDNIEKLLDNIAEEHYTSKSMTHIMESKKSTLEKLSENNKYLLTELDNLELNDDEIKLLNEKETAFNTEIMELSQQAENLLKSIDELEKQKDFLEQAQTQLREISFAQKAILEKKNLYTSIQDLKTVLTEKTQDLHNLKENASKQENLASHMESQIKLCDIELNDITDQIHKEKNIHEQLAKDREEVEKNRDSLKKDMIEIDEKLSVLMENKNKEELSIKISSEKENFLLGEITKLNENVCTTEKMINELNEKISKVQNELDEKTKPSQETPSYLVEKSNNVLDLKIRRYVKAIEVIKKNRAAQMAQKERNATYSDSSQDSMLLPKKKKYS